MYASLSWVGALLGRELEPQETARRLTLLGAAVDAIEPVHRDLGDVVLGFELLSRTGLLSIVLPELEEGRGVEQRERHCYDVFMHSLYSCAAADSADLGLRLAALLHDVGKPATLSFGEAGEPDRGLDVCMRDAHDRRHAAVDELDRSAD